MIEEMEVVVLTRDLPERALVVGDLGTVVHRFPDGHVFLVEFIRGDGHTVGVEELTARDIRPLAADEIGYTRRF
jgi:hypothetical protein